MANWIKLARVSEVPLSAAKECVAEGRIIALFNVGGTFYALDGVCPHQGGPLGRGELGGCIVTCPWHGWQFDVCNGEFQLRKSMLQPKFNTRIVGDDVQVEIDA